MERDVQENGKVPRFQQLFWAEAKAGHLLVLLRFKKAEEPWFLKTKSTSAQVVANRTTGTHSEQSYHGEAKRSLEYSRYPLRDTDMPRHAHKIDF